MLSAFPVFIGITGKRQLSESPDQATSTESSVRLRLALALDHIEALLPNTRKILLTGMAAGSDLLAAQEVLRIDRQGKERRNWLVLAALPFDEHLFKEDFTPEEWATYQEVARDPRTRRWTLPPLKSRTGVVAVPSELSRVAASDERKELRSKHYEQVGLWIANTANVLIAAISADEKPDKIGGTARIVAYRRGAPPDPVTTEVIAASSVLAGQNELERPSSGYVWLIDPSRPEEGRTLRVRVLPPYDEDESSNLPVVGHKVEDAPAEAKASQAALFRQSMALMRRARRYERVTVGHHAATIDTDSAWPTHEKPAVALDDISRELNAPAYRAARISRNAFHLLAALFLAAFLMFEVFAKLLPKQPMALVLYVMLLSATLGVYFFARWKEWQPIAEDRRTIREALRVQLAWWWSGLADQVDHHYLRGADRELARVREAACNLITMALLSCPDRKSEPDWKLVFDPGDRKPFHPLMSINDHPKDWIGSQLYYFQQRGQQREAKNGVSNALSWILFVTSAWLSVLLFLWLNRKMGMEELTLWLSAHDQSTNRAILGAITGIAVAAGCWWGFTRARLTQESGSGATLALVLAFPGAVGLWLAIHSMATIALPPVGLSLSLGIFVALAAIYGCFWLWRVLPDANLVHPAQSVAAVGAILIVTLSILPAVSKHSEHFENGRDVDLLAEYMAILVIAFLPAMAGAMRFVSEKLAVDAEALSYRDALVWFKRADQLLTVVRPGEGRTESDDRAREIVRELGLLALGESEDWLKSRRERPLSPLIGG